MEKRDKSRAISPNIKNRKSRPKWTAAQIKRIRFARSMTRDIFGRFYWNDRMEAELLESLETTKNRLENENKCAKDRVQRKPRS